ncbi:hypothetical protein K2Q16_00230 [Patescibacteria group bacterium]|nr:hypothetical protein [Patescibacteria group bacterium]
MVPQPSMVSPLPTIYRDGSPIATTTLTSFSDTGLVASTTYTYFVQAFDWLFAFSSSSNSLATTTLAPPVAPPPTPAATSSGTTASGRLSLRGPVLITPDVTSVIVTWTTNRPSRFVLRWGKTSSYESGFIATERYREVHNTELTDLIPGTVYQYELVGINPANDIEQVLGRGTFTTKSPVSQAMPQNVSRLTAVAIGHDVRLRWDNPLQTTPHQVRIVRNHLGFPADPHDGMVVYQGDGESVLDQNALAAYGFQFYTVYVLDVDGGVSSGAVVRVVRAGEGVGVTEVAPIPETTVPVLPPDVVLTTLKRSSIQILQGEYMNTFADPLIELSAVAPFSLLIPVEALPRHLKSIIVSLLDPTDYTKSYTFLLRLNAAGTAYETTLAPLAAEGISQLLIEVYDYETRVVGRYGKQVIFIGDREAPQEVVFPDALLRTMWLFPFLPGAVSLLWFLFLLFMWRRLRRKREDNSRALPAKSRYTDDSR